MTENEAKLKYLLEVLKPIACDCCRCCLVAQWNKPNNECPYYRIRMATIEIEQP